MKPFNLEEALAGKPIVTRNGKPARIICFDKKSSNGHNLVVLIDESRCTKDEKVICTNPSGSYFLDGITSQYDLFMASIKKKGWVNIYHSVYGVCASLVYDTYEEAKLNQTPTVDYIGISEVVWEE